jgi:hypothetical protein
MQRITRNPYLIFPLGAAASMAGLVILSLLRDDPLSVNIPFVAFLALVPLVAGWYFFSTRSRAKRGWWILHWLGTAVLGVLATGFVLFGSLILIPPGPYEAYNYAHFNFAAYDSVSGQRVSVGGEALDATLYTLEEDNVKLSDLWAERPIVLEFGSLT